MSTVIMEHMRPNVLTKTQITEMVDRYLAGESTTILAAAYGVAHQTVGYHVKKVAATRSYAETHKARYALRHDAFDELGPESMYWLGFLFTDGCIEERPGKKQAALRLMLAECDAKHVEKFQTFLGAEAPVRYQAVGGRYSAAALVIISDPLTGRLRDYGRYEGEIDPRLLVSRDFWRGAVDGDGSIGLYERAAVKKYGYGLKPSIAFVGSRRLVEPFLDFAVGLGLSRVSVVQRRGCVEVSWGWRHASLLIDALYTDACVSLDRKQAVAEQIMALEMDVVSND